MREYIRDQGILHSVAHPLFRVNDRLTLDQVEKLLVLFDRFEALNGMHDRRANDLVRRIFGSLTREMIEDLAERHRLEPFGPTPWRKTFTGGSDDHGGLYLGDHLDRDAGRRRRRPDACTVEEFLEHLRAGRHEPGGETGSSARLLQSLYTISYEHYRRQFPFGLERRNDPFSELLRSLALPGSSRGAAGLAPAGAGPSRRKAEPGPAERATFGAASRASQKHLARMLRDFVRHARRGRLMEGLASVAQLAPFALSVAPHLVAVHSLHKDADLLDAASERFLGRRLEGRSGKRAWLTDSLAAADGMARVLSQRLWPGAGDLEAVTCAAGPRRTALPVHRFPAWMEVPLPGWERRKLAIPPLLEVIDHCETERYAEIVISTPGPFGLLGLLAGKLLGIPVTAVWQDDVPTRVRAVSGSDTLAEMSLAVPALALRPRRADLRAQPRERETLIARGFDRDRLAMIEEPAEVELVGGRGGSRFGGGGLLESHAWKRGQRSSCSR